MATSFNTLLKASTSRLCCSSGSSEGRAAARSMASRSGPGGLTLAHPGAASAASTIIELGLNSLISLIRRDPTDASIRDIVAFGGRTAYPLEQHISSGQAPFDREKWK